MTETPGPILIVEDDADVRELLVRRFNRAGHRTVAVGSGEGALEALGQDRPGLAVVDIMLPGMTGWEFIRQLRADPRSSTVPVYVLSILDPPDGTEITWVDGYVVKPFRSRDIENMLRTIETSGS